MKHFGHTEPVVTKVMLGREHFIKISSSPVKVHENLADGSVADGRSQAGGRVLCLRFFFSEKKSHKSYFYLIKNISL